MNHFYKNCVSEEHLGEYSNINVSFRGVAEESEAEGLN